MARSRLKRHLQEQSSRNIFLTIGGIITILILLFTFGPELLINFSLLVKKSDKNEVTNNNLSYIAPPILSPMNEATKSAQINISGYAGEKQNIKLYLNGKLVDSTEVKKDKQFVFQDVKLKEGQNEIKTKAVTENDKESEYSATITITYSAKPPTLDLSTPQDGQTVSKNDSPITVRGKTDPGVKVTVNDFWAISEDDGAFSYALSLHDGENPIKIVATDPAGNQTTKEIKIKTN